MYLEILYIMSVFFSFYTDYHDLFAVSRRGGVECKRPDNLT